MSHSYHQNFVHIVFSTKGRRETITSDIEDRLHAYLGGILRDEGGAAIIVGGTKDHVHVLARTPKAVTDIDLMRNLKANSSKWVHQTFPNSANFGWQTGYGWFSVSKSRVPSGEAYIADQKEHHRTMSFQEEFIELLKRHGIEYDERYLWG